VNACGEGCTHPSCCDNATTTVRNLDGTDSLNVDVDPLQKVCRFSIGLGGVFNLNLIDS